MSKNKLQKFAEMESFRNVFQCAAADLGTSRDATGMCGHWSERCFKNQHPIVLELGCGRGEYTVALARMFPDRNFIGVDIKGARMYHGARTALEEGLENVAFLRTNIEFIDRFFAPDEVDEIWITFPDPQMKKVTKRLVGTTFLQRYQRFLRDEGLIHLKTDSPFLYAYTEAMLQANSYRVEVQTDDLYRTLQQDPILSIQTYYEQQWLSRGLTIKYVRFALAHRDHFVEPQVDIERDTYRSYGRGHVRSDQETA
ncbi:MAG: tRNA (guanosine(46)-N7)-methyltransferase TrmB [Paludibacteraceae bacterium]|nr:tRNA (guanosine(46)-N7)-methyltransferase TrmB [Paludibacteraceae bacterium]